MSRALIIQNGWLKNDTFKNKLASGEKASFGKDFSRNKAIKRDESISGGTKISLVSTIFIVFLSIFLAGIFYLYQVNSLATQGFEIREIENKIMEAEKERKQLQIKEIELRSMYNIEKATENLNLVNSSNITYLEVAGPVAMR